LVFALTWVVVQAEAITTIVAQESEQIPFIATVEVESFAFPTTVANIMGTVEDDTAFRDAVRLDILALKTDTGVYFLSSQARQGELLWMKTSADIRTMAQDDTVFLTAAETLEIMYLTDRLAIKTPADADIVEQDITVFQKAYTGDY